MKPGELGNDMAVHEYGEDAQGEAFVTSDLMILSGRGLLDPIDVELMKGKRLMSVEDLVAHVVETMPGGPDAALRIPTGEALDPSNAGENIRELARQVPEAFDHFVRVLRPYMDDILARYVRRLRITKRCSWRAVARGACMTARLPIQPPANQIAGMALCQLAAEREGKSYNEEPWN